MIAFLLHLAEGSVRVSLDAGEPDAYAEVEVEGPGASLVARWLRRQTGAFGHVIGERTTAVDLCAVLSTPSAKARYAPELVAGSMVIGELASSASDGVT